MKSDYTSTDVRRALASVGISAGDTLLVHSALYAFGKTGDCQDDGIPALLCDELRNAIGESGTIVVPTFNFGFCRGEPYDPAATPSSGMGVFSEYIRNIPGARRSPHAMQSVAAIGGMAATICEPDPPSAFDPEGAFGRMLALDTKLLLLGASSQAASLVHFAEERAAVPYRYWKTFSGQYRRDGAWGEAQYSMYVRELTRDPRLLLRPVAEALAAAGRLRKARLGRGVIQCCLARDFVDVALTGLWRNPLWLLRNPECMAA